MKSLRNCLIALLSLTAIAGAWFGWSEYLETVDLRAQLGDPAETVAQQHRLDALTAKNKELQEQVAVLQNQIGLLQDQLNARGAAATMPPAADPRSPVLGPPPGGAPLAQDTSAVARAMLGNASTQLTTAQAMTVVGGHYDALLKQLGLSPEQADQFKNMMALRIQLVAGAVTPLVPTDGSDPAAAMPAIRQAAANAEQALAAQIQAQFGADVASQYLQYQQTFPQRNTIDQLALVLGNTPAPLSDSQYSQMVQLLLQTQVPDDGGGPQRVIFGSVNYHSRISDQTIAAASTVLSQDQVQILRQLQKQQ